MDADKPDSVSEPGLEAIHTTTISYFRAMGKRILALRRSREMSQGELARMLGFSQQSVFTIENGERRLRLDLLPVLARTFKATVPASTAFASRTSGGFAFAGPIRSLKTLRSSTITDGGNEHGLQEWYASGPSG